MRKNSAPERLNNGNHSPDGIKWEIFAPPPGQTANHHHKNAAE
ncbi:MAG: hypothetical protein N2487_03740 [Verrucomicrobiae bacterium]|nr:hypothetical protein [Verrucomicrobiae bacterium]